LTRRLDVRWREVDQRTGAAEIDGLHDRNLLRPACVGANWSGSAGQT
jgi:hypothetical protein